MRQITAEAINAFYNYKKFSKSNMSVTIHKTENEKYSVLRLHGNAIASLQNGVLKISTAGWNTRTTRERLNGLQGVNINTKKDNLYLNGYPWDGEWIEPDKIVLVHLGIKEKAA